MSIARELSDLLVGLVSGVYPAFVRQGQLRSEIPVFLYHRIDSTQFSAHLRYLSENGYRSLFADEHFDTLTGSRLPTKSDVVLTFDDGLSDLYDRAFPLLQKYDAKAVTFIIPSRVGHRGMVTWTQLHEMHQSGLVDVQSHSLHHAAIPISPRVMDFFHPKYRVFQPWEFPVGGEWEGGVPSTPPAYGTPILESYSRLGDRPRYFPGPSHLAAYLGHVERSGGENFFRSLGWRRILRRSIPAALHLAKQGRYEALEEQRAAIIRELVESKRIIEKRLSGKHVRHFAYPWNQVGQITKGLLRECGYVSAYAGPTPHKGPILNGDSLYEIARISGDFVPCLPGERRASFMKVLAYKLRRRLAHGRPY